MNTAPEPLVRLWRNMNGWEIQETRFTINRDTLTLIRKVKKLIWDFGHFIY